jgi:hypothetical protein
VLAEARSLAREERVEARERRVVGVADVDIWGGRRVVVWSMVRARRFCGCAGVMLI